MLIYFKQSLKKIHEKHRQLEETRIEVSELQDAVIEIAEIVSELIDNTAGGDNDG